MGFSLTILEGPEAGKSYQFDRVEITIGRTMENDVVITDPSISRQHMHIRDKGGAFIAKDLGSSNGTRVNGKLIKEEVLRPGDIIEVGKVRLKFESASRKAGKPDQPTERKHLPQKPATVQGKGAPASAAVSRKAEEQAQPRPAAATARPVIRSSGLRSGSQDAASAAPGGSAGSEQGGAAVLAAIKKIWLAARLRFRRLDKRLRLAICGVSALLLLLLMVKVFQSGRDMVRQITDHSMEIFEPGMTDSSGEVASFGLGDVTFRCREAANFRFKYTNGRAVAVFMVGGIDKRGELTVKLNDVPILNIPEPWAVDKWSDVIFHKLSRKHLLENEENKLSFVNNINAANPDAKEQWGVQLFEIQEAPLPAPDINVARQNFELGKKRYERKDVAPENLYQALQNYENARDYLELLPEDSLPEIYGESCEMVDRINRELDERFKAWMFDASRAVKYGRYKEAVEIYRRLLKAFPNQEDPRHQEAKAKLMELE